MKKMLFVIPWSEFHIGLSDFDFSQMPERAPEGVTALATFLKSKGAEVQIADMLCVLIQQHGDTRKALDILFDQCSTFQPDIIGFSFFTARLAAAADIFSALNNFYKASGLPRPFIMAGGVHATLLPELALSQIPFDALSLGEGEYPLLQLLEGKSPADTDGIMMPNGKRSYPKEVVRDLDTLPFTDWSLIDKDFYSQPSHQISGGRKDAVMPITFSRGCMYRCNFCAHASFLKPRRHSAEFFIRKMDSYAQQCNISTFIIQDSSIGNFKDEWIKVCRLLIERGTPYRWWANLRANQADRELLAVMKQAGCIKLFFGFESGSQRVLDRMNKRISVEQCKEAARLCHELELPFYASFITNYFDEEESDLELTEQLIRQTRPTSVAVNRFSPIPGSHDFDSHAEQISPTLNSIKDWTQLGRLCSDLYFSNMKEEKYVYWNRRLKELRRNINSHEDTD